MNVEQAFVPILITEYGALSFEFSRKLEKGDKIELVVNGLFETLIVSGLQSTKIPNKRIRNTFFQFFLSFIYVYIAPWKCSANLIRRCQMGQPEVLSAKYRSEIQ